MRTLLLTCCLLLFACGPTVASQSAPKAAPSQAELEELWKTGSLWQVGDNIPKVDAARKALVEAGEAGLAFAFTKLGSSDSLQYRCLEVVFKGFGAQALPGLLERMAHEEVQVRRNVAALLGVIDDRSVAGQMVEHLKKEADLRCKVGHLQTLARWKEPTALGPLIDCTRVTQDKEPLAERLKVRIVPLLANYEDEKVIARLIELLDDDAYFVRDAARDALKGSPPGIEKCRQVVEAALTAKRQVALPASMPLLLGVCAASSVRGHHDVFLAALAVESGALRSAGARALSAYLDNVAVALKGRAKSGRVHSNGMTEGEMELGDFQQDLVAIKQHVDRQIKSESDPGALASCEELLEALARLLN